MPYGEVFSALGGGVAGLLGVLVIILLLYIRTLINARFDDYQATITELKAEKHELLMTVKEQTEATRTNTVAQDKLAAVIQSWMPERQLRPLQKGDGS